MDMSTPMGRGPKMKLVMVGNGMAGVRTLEELLKLAPDLYDITVFGAEPHPNYNRILLSPVLAGEQTVDDIVLNPLDWYSENHITLHKGKKVVKIDRSARFVETEDGTRAEYDRLLLATGSNPFILPVPGKELKGVIAYRDIADTNTMIEAAAIDITMPSPPITSVNTDGRAGSSRSRARPAASAAGSRGGTTRPVTSASTASVIAPTGVDTTGTPQAIACMIACGTPSSPNEGSAKSSSACSQGTTSCCWPTKRTAPTRPSRARWASSRSR